MVSAEVLRWTDWISQFQGTYYFAEYSKAHKMSLLALWADMIWFHIMGWENDSALAQLTPDAAFPVAREAAASATSPAVSNASSWVMDWKVHSASSHVKTNESVSVFEYSSQSECEEKTEL